MIQLGPYRLDLINDGLFELRSRDFIPPQPADSAAVTKVKSRVLVGFNSLVVRGNGRMVVIDPGTGDKPRIQQVRQYKMEWPRKFFGELESLGIRREDVDAVILTHLHWDHCGGGTALDSRGRLVPAFPRARYYVQPTELEAARAAVHGGDDGYLAEDFEPLIDSGVLELLDGDAEVFPDFETRWTPGHSDGHQVVIMGAKDEPKAIYLSDLVPTSAQLSPTSGMSYDIDHERLADSKQRILREAEDQHYLLLFVHAPRLRAGYLRRKGEDLYDLEAVEL